MKISESQVKNVIRIYNEKKMSKNHDSVTDGPLVPVSSLVSVSVEIKKYHGKYRDIPNIREHLIHNIKDKIQNGTYQVCGYDVVEKIMGREAANLLIDESIE